jgi:hypothetical protein
MKVGEILARCKSRLSRYRIDYRYLSDSYYDLFLSEDEVKPIQIRSILVLTDKRPRSLIAIAYALRFAEAFNAKLLAITTGVHQKLIEGEAESYNINLTLLKTLEKYPSLEHVMELINKYDVGLVILHNLYAIINEIQVSSPVPVLVVKVERFYRNATKAAVEKDVA